MIFDYLSQSKKLKTVSELTTGRIAKSNDNFNIYAIASDYQSHNRMLFVVLPTLFEAQNYYDALVNLLDEDEVLFFPVDEMVSASIFISSNEFKYERITTILGILSGKKKIIVTNVNGILKGNLPLKSWEESLYKLEVNKSYDIKTLKEILVQYGYHYVDLVKAPGEFSLRGSIIDFYPITTSSPVRLDFFDDELESIKLFDTDTQLSKVKLKEFILYPIVELFYDNQKQKEMLDFFNSKKELASKEELDILYEDLERLELRNEVDLLFNYASAFYNLESVLDFNNDSKIYLINEDKINNLELEIKNENEKYYDSINSVILKDYEPILSLESVLKAKKILYVDTLVEHTNAYLIGAEKLNPIHGNFNELLKDCNQKVGAMKVLLLIKNADRVKRIKDFFLDNKVKYKTVNEFKELDHTCINIYLKENGLSLSLPDDNIFLLDENLIFENAYIKRKIRYNKAISGAQKISNYQELKKGDYVVHLNHGIGLYEGIKTLELSGKKRDYLSIVYQGDDHLFIPIEQLSLIKKYSGSEERTPKLTKLGSNSWTKTKAKVKEKVLELGQKLIELYAEREKAQGYKFAPDSDWQKDFESDFQYEETPDQIKAINAVKKDMESARPMDRLICGDVGFGKTEIALRAAFKAVMDGKQVCYLAPTTVLTRQHYYTFRSRMDRFGVKVELLNRFVSSKDTKRILEDLKAGNVDIIIGTHRLLSDDVKFKDLGLLITDEEQRFGVMHKEKIKEMKINVDSLMLTATPIPRTLQMSLIGIKELSMIETPPKNRYPVQTYVTPRHDTIIKEAIERELLRNGQVFYLYNYTDDIEEKANHIASLVPNARICYAHGKLNKVALEKIITDFIDHKYDVLVSTTIIETGIDIPEANTLLIHDADRLGLSQLYQIRGRVGRSDRIAYAYLMYEPRKVLTEDAEKRLKAIKEFTELGSGFQIAMRDLAIRGAGDILGQEQSGFIDSVGIETYMQILDDTLKEMRGVKDAPKAQIATTSKHVLANRYIPDSYNLSEKLKIEVHNAISKITNINELTKLQNDIEDRYGKVTLDLETYMYERLFNSLCKQVGIKNVDIKPNMVTLMMSEEVSETRNGEFIYQKAYELSNAFLLSYHDKKIYIALKIVGLNTNKWLKLICEYLTNINTKEAERS